MSASGRIGYLETVRAAVTAEAIVESRLTRRLLAALLFALTVAAYLPVVDNAFIWDDDDYVYANPTLLDADGLRRIWFERGAIPQYYPLVHTSYWLEYRLWGADPLGYHVVNVLLHGLCALLFWRVLAFLRVPGAWWAAALFALHPVHVESVAWITERKNVLSGAFYFASFLSYLHATCSEDARNARSEREGRLYAASLLFFVAALLSKTVSASLPAVLLIVTWWQRRALDRGLFRDLTPFLAIGLIFGLATSLYETFLVGAIGPTWDLPVVDRVLVAGRALWFYLAKLVWPHPVVFNYPRWTIDASAAWQYAYPITAVATGLALFAAAGRIGRGAISAAMIFAGTLFPALGFFNVYPMRYSFVADHFQYLASAAPIAYATGVAFFWANTRSSALGRRLVRAFAVVVLALFALLDWQRLPDYRNAETLWRATLRDNPDSWLAHASLCSIEQERAEYALALMHCESMLALEPDNHETHHMFGILQIARGQTEFGIRHYRRAIEIEPNYLHASNSLAVALNEQQRYREAIPHLRDALARNPDYAEAHSNLGNALVGIGQIDEGIAHHRDAVRLAPGFAPIHNNLAAALLRAGQLQLARTHLVRVTQLQPDSKEAVRQLEALDRVIRRKRERNDR